MKPPGVRRRSESGDELRCKLYSELLRIDACVVPGMLQSAPQSRDQQFSGLVLGRRDLSPPWAQSKKNRAPDSPDGYIVWAVGHLCEFLLRFTYEGSAQLRGTPGPPRCLQRGTTSRRILRYTPNSRHG